MSWYIHHKLNIVLWEISNWYSKGLFSNISISLFFRTFIFRTEKEYKYVYVRQLIFFIP